MTVPRDLYNVRTLPAPDGPTPLTGEEEARARTTLFNELGRAVSERGHVRFPAHSPAERLRLIAVAERLTAYWGMPVRAVPEDAATMRLYLDGHGPAAPAVRER